MATRNPLVDDAALTIGALVVARWTNCFRQYEARATVVKVNRKSVRVTLVDGIDGYPAGREIVLPRFENWRTWSVNNCARPIDA